MIEPVRIVPDPALSDAAWRIVRRRHEAGAYEEQYRAAFERLHGLVPQSVREATAAEEVIEQAAKELADRLEDAAQDYFAEQSHDKVAQPQGINLDAYYEAKTAFGKGDPPNKSRRESPRWRRSGP